MSILGILLLGFAIVFIFVFNGMILKRTVLESSYAAVRGLLKLRCDLIDALPDDDAQAPAMQEITQVMRKSSTVEQIKLDKALTALTAQYLTAKENSDLAELEKKLIEARNMYNAAAASFNNAAAVQPGKLIAKLRKWEMYPIWEF